MASVDIGVRDAAEHRKVLTMFLEDVEIRGELVILAGTRWQETGAEEAQVVADSQHASRSVRAGSECRPHPFEHGQRQRDARATEKLPSRYSHFRPLLIQKQIALDDTVDERPYAISIACGRVQNALDFGTIRKARRRTGGISNELPHQVASDLPLILEQQAFEFDHIVKCLAACPVPARINRLCHS